MQIYFQVVIFWFKTHIPPPPLLLFLCGFKVCKLRPSATLRPRATPECGPSTLKLQPANPLCPPLSRAVCLSLAAHKEKVQIVSKLQVQCSSSAAAEQQPSSDDDDDGNGNLNPAFNGRAMLLWAAVGWAGGREKGKREGGRART